MNTLWQRLSSCLGRKQPENQALTILRDHDFSRIDYTVIDCEMTGLNAKNDRLLSIGAVRIRDGEIHLEDSFYRLIRQDPSFLRDETIRLHRLNHDMIAQGADQSAVIDELRDFCKGTIAAGHFFHIDLKFLLPLQPKLFEFPPIDTMQLAHWILKKRHPQQDVRHQLHLDDLCQSWSIPRFPAHHALGDALRSACLLLALQGELRQRGLYTLAELLNIGRAKGSIFKR